MRFTAAVTNEHLYLWRSLTSSRALAQASVRTWNWSALNVHTRHKPKEVEGTSAQVPRTNSKNVPNDEKAQDAAESQSEYPTAALHTSNSFTFPGPFQDIQDQASPRHIFHKVSSPASQQSDSKPESQPSLFIQVASKTDRVESTSSLADSYHHSAYAAGSPKLNPVGLCEENAVGSWPKLGQDSSQVWCEQYSQLSPYCLQQPGLSSVCSYSPEEVPVLQEFMEDSSEPGTQKQLQMQASDTLFALLVVEDTSHKAQMGPFQHQDLQFCKGSRSNSSHHQPTVSGPAALLQKNPDPKSMHSLYQTHQEYQKVESRDLNDQGAGTSTENMLTQVMLVSGNPVLMKDMLVHSNSSVLKEDTVRGYTNPVQTMMDPQLLQKAEGKQQSSHGNMPFAPDPEWVASLFNAQTSSELCGIRNQVYANAQPYIVLGRKSQQTLVLASHGRTFGTQDMPETQGDICPESPGLSSPSLSEGSSSSISVMPESTVRCDESQSMECFIPESMKSSPKTLTSSIAILSDSLSLAGEENSDSVLSFCPIKELACPSFEWANQLSPCGSKIFHLKSPSQSSISPKHMFLTSEEIAPKPKNTSSSSSILSSTDESADCFFTPPESPSLLQDCLQDTRTLEDQAGTSKITGGNTSAALTLKGSPVRSERRGSSDEHTAGRLFLPKTHHHKRDDWDQETTRFEDCRSSWSPSSKEPDNKGIIPEQETKEDMDKVYKEIQKDLYVRATLFYKFLRSGRTRRRDSQ
ncbi:uncharacterized protein LOC115462007 [Microcaecilia unicolor]|uniref:Uncharacterized protein LOC115462007 n=1 Tax=Microcaecilia unicolor TaxID=1415580 RepID=A0A6P7XCM5_9AMPH|nr:uncharacterized protein LOC115462007 [Microcaecilia unicolor]